MKKKQTSFRCCLNVQFSIRRKNIFFKEMTPLLISIPKKSNIFCIYFMNMKEGVGGEVGSNILKPLEFVSNTA